MPGGRASYRANQQRCCICSPRGKYATQSLDFQRVTNGRSRAMTLDVRRECWVQVAGSLVRSADGLFLTVRVRMRDSPGSSIPAETTVSLFPFC